MIKLGRERIITLIKLLHNPEQSFLSFHVAGTNGKGSVCSYLSSILQESDINVGRFTSPHLFHPRDSININGVPANQALYADAKAFVEFKATGLDATEFELLTATAFEIFARKAITAGVIEVGLGGRHDATNLNYPKKNTIGIITKIGMDHQSLLGNTITDIASEKAGIIKKKVPVVVHGGNDFDVLKIIESNASTLFARLNIVWPDELKKVTTKTGDTRVFYRTEAFGDIDLSQTPLNGEYQYMNLALALKALDLMAGKLRSVTRASISSGIQNTTWPGRLQFLDPLMLGLENKNTKILLDGAHNTQAAQALSKFVSENLRGPTEKKVIWIMALSGDRNPYDLLPLLLKPGDSFYATTFGEVEGMPWVKPQDPAALERVARDIVGSAHAGIAQTDTRTIIQQVGSKNLPIVICGSLYLAADTLKLLNN
ncbi:Mur ligase [Lipomyces japonicus]|uniref:Mur ligase n=1 Tax=Lipomyces japonicus TaxID=56871 RepID=UPI0034CDB2F6